MSLFNYFSICETYCTLSAPAACVPAGKKPLRGFFGARRAQYPLRPHKTRTPLHHA